MGNKSTLKGFTSEQSREKAKENGRKGGIASGIAKRKNKSMKETAKMVLSLPASSMPSTIEELKKYMDVNEKETTIQDAIVIFQAINAIVNKNTKSAEFMRDTAGEKPAQAVDMNAEVTSGDFTLKVTGDDDADD